MYVFIFFIFYFFYFIFFTVKWSQFNSRTGCHALHLFIGEGSTFVKY